MFHYFLQDHTGFLRAGYMASFSKEAAQEMLERAHIRELFDLTPLPEEAIPKGARYMYPFEGKWHGEKVQGTVEGETILSALEHLTRVFDGTVELIAERAPKTPEERTLFTTQTAAFLASMAPAPKMEVSVSAAVSTVLDRQFFETLTKIRSSTQELLRERQFADEVQEMHRIIFSLEQKHDLALKDKYDALSYILRELSYIQDGLDPSPLKKEMAMQIEHVVGLLKKVEKSMVRTAFHLDNVRIHQDSADQLPEEELASVPEEALSRYASRKRLVAEIMLGIRALQPGKGSMAMAGAGAASASTTLPHLSAEEHHEQTERTAHASEPLSQMLLRELPMLLEWFVSFSLAIIILGQIIIALESPWIIGGYDLGKMLAPFAWQHVFLKTTLLATFALIGLRAYESFVPLWRWLTLVLLFLGAALVFLAL